MSKNIRVKQVIHKKLDKLVPVYDLNVPIYNNFLLANGIAVHNSGSHNIPDGDIKKIYTSRFKGGCIAMPDGSAMEIRVLSAESGDENLMQAFRDGLDIHRYFASKIFKVEYDDVEGWMRKQAKSIVFGIIYGESEQSVADAILGGDLNAAKKIFSDMFDGFPRIREYIERVQNQYLTYKKVTNITNRYIDLSTAGERYDENSMLRKSTNYPIQSSAEDIAGVIMYKLLQYIKNNNMKSKVFLFIHDSIEIDIHPDELFELIEVIDRLFNEFPDEEFGVPVECDIPIGPSLGQDCVIEEYEFKDNYNEATIVLEGFIRDIDELFNIWKDVYDIVEYIDLDEYSNNDKEKYESFAEAFLPKKARISMDMGKYIKIGNRKIHVVRNK